MEPRDKESHEVFSNGQKKYIVKKRQKSEYEIWQDSKEEKVTAEKSFKRAGRVLLFICCLIVSPAIYDQFAPLKEKTEIVKVVNHIEERVSVKNSSSNIYFLTIITNHDKYKFFGPHFTEYSQISIGDTLTISKTQILNIPLKLESRRLNFENHEDDYYVFYSARVVVFLFLLSFLFSRESATIIIVLISASCTIVCFGMYL